MSLTELIGITVLLFQMWTREQCLHQTAGVGGDIGPRPRRPKRPGSRRKEEGRSNSVDSGSSEDPSDPRRRSSPVVITASLTIPMSDAFTLNLDDPDIPYIEEAPKQPSAPPRRQRQRSISGCSEGSLFTRNSMPIRVAWIFKNHIQIAHINSIEKKINPTISCLYNILIRAF